MRFTSRNYAKRAAIALLVFIMLMGTVPVFAAEGSSTTGSTELRTGFPDVSSSHWAHKYITKLALQGIINGYEDGQFKPENSVSQQDVLVMAVAMLGKEQEALQSNVATVLPIKLSDYAKPYVAQALEEGLIDLREETESSSESWGTKEATREWVTKIVIRMIGKQEDAKRLANRRTEFTDDQQISPSALGYVNEAVSLGIVSGFEDNSFNPKGSVTRAQMAVFLNGADSHSASHLQRVDIGYISEISSDNISIQHEDGTTNQYKLKANATLYNGVDDSTITASSLQQFQKVYVIHHQDSVYFVELLDEQAHSETYVGMLTNLDIHDLKLTLSYEGSAVDYELDSDVTVVDSDGDGASLSKLVNDSELELTRNTYIPNAKISQIVIKQLPVIETVTAVVQTIDIANAQIAVELQANGAEETYEVTQRTVISIDENASAKIADLHEGDTITVKTVNDEVREIKVIDRLYDQVDTGILKSVDLNQSIVTIEKEGNTLAAYAVLDDAVVQINGLEEATIEDLILSDQVRLEIKDNKVNKIIVSNRNIKHHVIATIINYDTSTKYLTVKYENEEGDLLRLTDKTVITYDGKPLALTSFASKFTKDKKIDMSISAGQVVSIQLATDYEGVITNLNSATSELTLKTAQNQVVTYKTTSSTIIDIFNKNSSKFADLKAGDSVKIVLNSSQDKIAKIEVRKTFMFTPVTINSSTKKITATDEQGDTHDFTIGNSIPVQYPERANLSFADIQKDVPITITFLGKSVEVVWLVQTVVGKVTEVDSNGKLTVLDIKQNEQFISKGAAVKVVKNNTVYTSIDYVKENDRVQIVKDAQGNIMITVLSPVTRTVSSYDSANKQMVFKRKSSADKNRYSFHPDAYIHDGSEKISPNFLMENDSVTIYLIGETIVELEK